MVAFVTLFLGLVLGPQDVTVAVSADVLRVELLLDGEVAASVDAEPWTARFDFGSELAPRELVAVAYNGEGSEVARTRQWLNLPQEPAVAQLLLEEGGEVRLTWESLAGAEPRAVRISFDGRQLEVRDPHRFTLPPHDPAQLHFLRAELDFDENVTSSAEMTFGGTYGTEVSTEMTAVPVVQLGEGKKKDREALTVESLQGLFRKGGEPVVVRAVDQGPPEVMMVLDRSFRRELETALIRNRQRTRSGSFSVWRFAATLKRGQRLRFVETLSERRVGVDSAFELFPLTPSYTSEDAGVFWLMVEYESTRQGKAAEQRLSDAVAVAGLNAAGLRRPRAVVLVLGREPEDRSQTTPALVRRYLEHLRVPLRVWAARPAKAPEWGEGVVDVSTMGKIEGAVEDLGRELERQWIVWLDGVHLPQSIVLAPEAAGIIELAE